MDPITTAELVHDRTDRLHRAAEQIRQERTLHSSGSVAAPAADAVVAQPRAAEPQMASATAHCCSSAEPAA